MRTIEGVLQTGDGEPIANAELIFTADRSVPTTLPALTAFVVETSGMGAYSVEVLDGVYRVALRIGDSTRTLGCITVTDGPTVDVITLLGVQAVPPSLTQQLIDELAAISPAVEDHETRLTAIEGGGGANHTHSNKATLDKFGETGSDVTFDGGVLMKQLIYDPQGRETNAFDLGQMTGNLDGGTF